ncbi:PREDICTED: uncharacterized protein LOC109162582 [Ipomoea nil]|uniref:uncharacterized protein LOC109162582 n=1 Tax=Ipomoea nil TaxID=35883 RepID=UPI00090138F7|nr:PREDICTED: uncharacterized protein LOC109162582 [Ipomoea nil]
MWEDAYRSKLQPLRAAMLSLWRSWSQSCGVSQQANQRALPPPPGAGGASGGSSGRGAAGARPLERVFVMELRISVLRTHPQFILMQVVLGSYPPWYLASVYGSPAHHLHRRLRTDLRQAENSITGPWIVVGDFNAVLNSEETSNYSSFSSHRSADFRNWIQDEGLIDLGFSGPKLIWVKNEEAERVKGPRLDRALCNTDWRNNFPGPCVTHLARIASDHAPLLLQVEQQRQQLHTAPFSFQAAWLTRTDVHDVVGRAWNSTRCFVDNTRTLAEELAKWNKESFGNVFKRKKVLMSRISAAQKALAANYHKGLAKLELKLREELEIILHQEELIWTVTKDEVHKALKDMKPFKAPGPDGFQAGFYQHMWDRVKDPENIRQFRPISLCNVSYKIITKTIINRLKLILPKIVGPFQSSFVPGRQISDNVIIFQEDTLEWAGFSGTIKDLIMTCVRTSRLSVIWNGDRLETFRPGRGIRQGDAMSLAIFVLCMERISQMIVSATDSHRWKGIKIAPNGPTLTHLCFADDMVLFTEATSEQVEVVKECLDRFCRDSGQRISLAKSHVFFPKNMDGNNADSIAWQLIITRTNDMGRYLGVPAFHGRITCASFSDLLDRISGRLEGWKARTLSMAGRVVLAKAVLNAIPAYTMQTAALPKSIGLEIEKMTRKFIWGGKNQEHKMSLVNWDLVTTEIDAGAWE